MLTIRPASTGSGSGAAPGYGARHPSDTARTNAGDLRDVPDYHPAFYSEPLPLPPRVLRPEPRLGRIVWPCWGLTRYAVGHLLMSPDDLAAVEAAGDAVTLEFLNKDGSTASLSMRIAGRRPLNDPRDDDTTAITPDDPDGRRVPWLATLVDGRHDRAGLLYAPITGGVAATWGQLFQELGSAAQYTISASAVNALTAGFPAPAAAWWGREAMTGRPAVVLLDAAAAAVGLRIAVAGDGTIQVQDSFEATTAFQDWWDEWGGEVGTGGRYSHARETPATLAVCAEGDAPVSLSMSGDSGTLSVAVQPSDSDAFGTPLRNEIAEWFLLDPASAEFRTHVPADAVALNHCLTYDSDRGTTTLERAPLWYPWPLAGSTTRADDAAAGYFPGCAGSGSGSGSASCAVWYTNYLHLAAVAVSQGQVLKPGQLLGYIGRHEAGAHVHFALGDGDPLTASGYAVPIAGKTVDVTAWLGLPIRGPRANCKNGPMGAAAFSGADLAYIQDHFAAPVKPAAGQSWDSWIVSRYHCDYDYYAVDIAWNPYTDQEEAGQPVYAATKGDDIITTVEAVSRHPVVGYAVLLRHANVCCQDPTETGDPHDPEQRNFPGKPPFKIPTKPPGVPRPHEPAEFNPVTRICLGQLDEWTLLGREGVGPGPVQVLGLGPEFVIEGGRLRLLSSVGGPAQSKPFNRGFWPVTVERTRVVPPAGTLIGGTTCSPPATTCCDGPLRPCGGDYDPILPVVVTGPFGPSCELAELTGVLTWDDGQWRYEGFVTGTVAGKGFLADVQLWQAAGGGWVATVEALYLSAVTVSGYDATVEQTDVPLLPVGDGTILAGFVTVVREGEPCSGTLSIEIGNPCPPATSGGISGGSGSGGVPTVLAACDSAAFDRPVSTRLYLHFGAGGALACTGDYAFLNGLTLGPMTWDGATWAGLPQAGFTHIVLRPNAVSGGLPDVRTSGMELLGCLDNTTGLSPFSCSPFKLVNNLADVPGTCGASGIVGYSVDEVPPL